MRHHLTLLLSAAAILSCGNANAITIAQADNFINLVYLDLLNRPADAPAYSAFESPLVSATLTTTQVAGLVLAGQEYRTDLIGSYYSSYLNRVPSGPEISPFLTLLGSGGTDQQVQSAILASAEFFGLQGSTNALYVAALFTDLLQRSGSPAESTPFVTALNGASLTRGQVASAFLGSAEYDTDLLTQYYSRFLGRTPLPAEANPFVSAMQGGTTNEQVIATILGSNEFFARAQQTPEPATWGLGLVGLSLLVVRQATRSQSTTC